MLIVIDGTKALCKAVEDVLGRETPVQRCTEDKKRNVVHHLPEADRARVSRRLGVACDLVDYTKAKALLDSRVSDLLRIYPTAARTSSRGPMAVWEIELET